ncbi:MAG: hypothetical protein JJU13_07460 [Balneolaceae bacterium]|nr:hypothetical protein [Balneolaceae bacterium]
MSRVKKGGVNPFFKTFHKLKKIFDFSNLLSDFMSVQHPEITHVIISFKSKYVVPTAQGNGVAISFSTHILSLTGREPQINGKSTWAG